MSSSQHVVRSSVLWMQETSLSRGGNLTVKGSSDLSVRLYLPTLTNPDCPSTRQQAKQVHKEVIMAKFNP